MPLKTVALIGAVCLTLGWLLASVLTPPVARVQALPERRAAPAGATAPIDLPTQLTEQLQLRLRRMPDPPEPRRNPFAFSTRKPTAPESLDRARPIEPEAAPVVVDVGPAFSLAGIAARQADDSAIHTAILSDGTTVHLLTAGDSIGGYTVTLVTERDVTLEDASGRRFVLRLR